jgi:pimeloyl-ACP methyl ester carboxylesterase
MGKQIVGAMDNLSPPPPCCHKVDTFRRPISAPTLVIWGERDSYLGSDLAESDRDDVPNLDRVERLADASDWVHHDEAGRVNQLLIDFFAPAA